MNDESLFAAAQDLDDPDRRAGLLAAACADAEQRRRVEGLLAASSQAGGFLEDSPVAATPQQIVETGTSAPGAPTLGGGATPTGAPRPAQVGEFRIIREIGRGGMGVVYEAEQVRLGRFVALKLLPDQVTANSGSRERFLREARAAAKLHHTNIVPVFGFGEANGTPFYAMQLIRGEGLDRVIERLRAQAAGGATPASDALTSAHDAPVLPEPSAETGRASHTSPIAAPLSVATVGWVGKDTLMHGIARIGLQVAQGLNHAHQQGILHRDVKPGNILLDGQGVAWITDFGLAKGEGLADLTQVGDLLGTLRYMPPESFSGQQGPLGDVYALGLTLYELIALRPAFEETARAKLIHQVIDAGPPRLRKLVPTVPRDLATIVHKAIDRDPARRYQSAAALADDLRRFLDDRPITARPVSAAEHGWRACKRNPILSGMAAAAVLGLMVGLVGSLWGQQTAVASADRATKERDKTLDTLREVKRLNDKIEAQKEQLAAQLYVFDMNRASRNFDAGRGDVAAALLARHRPETGQGDRRGLEWHLLRRNVDTAARTVRLADRAFALAYHPTADLIAVGQVGKVLLLSGKSGAEERSFPFLSKGKNVQAIAFAPDGKHLVALLSSPGNDHRGTAELRVWETTGRAVETVLIDTLAYDLAVNPVNGELYVACHDGTVRAFDGKKWQPARSLKGSKVPVIGVAVSPDGSQVAGGALDGAIRLWPQAGGDAVVLPRGGIGVTAPVGSLRFLAGNKRLATSQWGGEVKLWDLTMAPARFMFSFTPGDQRIVVSPDGTHVAAASRDGAIGLFDTANGRQTGILQVPLSAGAGPDWPRLTYRPDGKFLAAAASDNTLRLWNLDTAFPARVLRGSVSGVQSVALSPDGKTVAAGSAPADSRLRIHDAATGAEVKSLVAHGGSGLRRVRFSPDGKKLASVGDDGALVVRDTKDWSVRPGWSAACLPAPKDGGKYHVGASDLAFTPDGKKLAVVTWVGGRVLEFDVTGEKLRLLRSWAMPDDGRVWFVAYSPDGKKLSTTIWTNDTGRDFAIVWDVSGEKQKELFRLSAPVGSVGTVAFSPDGKQILGECADAVRFWDANTGKPLPRQLRGVSHGRVTYSADGSRILTVGRAITVWDAGSGEELLTLTGHTDLINDVSISADSQRIASASGDRTVRVWDAPRK